MPALNTPQLQQLGLPPQLDKYLREVRDAVNPALVKGDSYQLTQKYTATSPLVVPADWQAVSFLNSWVAFDGVIASRYRKDASGRVDLQLHVKNGSTAQAVVCNLPAGYRPSQIALFAARGAPNAFAALQVLTTGDVNFPDLAGVTDASCQVSFHCSDFSPYVPTCFPFDVAWNGLGLPSVAIVQAQDVTTAATPANLAIGVPDWVLVSVGGVKVIRIRNIPGLLPARSYAVQVAAWV